jgi:hypothetical protein
MTLSYPTRNEARSILTGFPDIDLNKTYIFNKLKEYLALYSILAYQNKYKIDFVAFVFTNALVDMFSDMNVENENFVETHSIFNSRLTNKEIDFFFIEQLGISFENFLIALPQQESLYKVKISNDGPFTFNPGWFNNSEKFIQPLLLSYQRFKKEKGMLFQRDDIKQIPIDYSVIICYNHYKYNGFLTRDICLTIIKTLTDATNECINSEHFNYSDIEFNVFRDLEKPQCIKAALEFIEQL